MFKYVLATLIVVATAHPAVASFWGLAKCSDSAVEEAVSGQIIQERLGKVHATKGGAFVGSGNTYSGISYRYKLDIKDARKMVIFTFKNQRERGMDKTIDKRYCAADLSGELDMEAAARAIQIEPVGILQGTTQSVALKPGDIKEATESLSRMLGGFIRWSSPQNFSIQELDKGGLFVTLDE